MTEISLDEISRAKRAVVVLMESFKAAYGKEAPLGLRQDVNSLCRIIRQMEAMQEKARAPPETQHQ